MTTMTIVLVLGGAGLLMLLCSALLRRRATATGPIDPAELTEVLRREGRTAAVRRHRRRTGGSLLEAVEAVDRIDG